MNDGYAQWATRRNLSPETIRLWIGTQERFVRWFGSPLADATDKDIERWLWDAQPHLSAASRHTYRKGLRSYYQWAIRERLADRDPTDNVPVPRLPIYRPHPMPTGQLTQALNAAEPLMRAMLCLGCFQGLRVSEMAALLRCDVNEGDMTVVGKGRRQRTVPSHPEALHALRALPMSGRFALGGITSGHLSMRGTRFLRGMGVTSLRPLHSLRAWYATELYRTSGHDLLLVRDMLGHASTDVTAIYVQVADGAAASAVARLAA